MIPVDVVLGMTLDGGDIQIENGQVVLDGGLESAVVLSLWGGNDDDPGGRDSDKEWWGNRGQTDPVRRYRSRTQHLVESLPLTSGNLIRVRDAIRADLAWLIDIGEATEIDISISVPRLNWIDIGVDIALAHGDRFVRRFALDPSVSTVIEAPVGDLLRDELSDPLSDSLGSLLYARPE